MSKRGSRRRARLMAAGVWMLAALCVGGCSPGSGGGSLNTSGDADQRGSSSPRTLPHHSSAGYQRVDASTAMVDVIAHPAFPGFGRFLFPTGRGAPDRSMTLADAGALLIYHSHVEVDTTVDVVNSLIGSVEAGRSVFYDIYTDAQKAADPRKRDTGLFFFAGRADAPFAIVSAGGGFSYVGSIHESLPYALELSRRGYNAFALQYRTGGAQVAYEDLAAAISFVFANARRLGVSTDSYSLWGGSAGARMAATLGSSGPGAYGGADLPQPAAVIMQYTGHMAYTDRDPPTYANVGRNDPIANWRTVQRRIDALAAAGIDTEFHVYPDLGHGFGLGIGTSAEGWLDDAVAFWEQHHR